MKVFCSTAHDQSHPLPTQLPQGEHTSGFVSQQQEINAVKTGPDGHTKAHKAVRSEACRVALAIAGTSITAFSRRRRSDR